jgi:hypothetical protein
VAAEHDQHDDNAMQVEADEVKSGGRRGVRALAVRVVRISSGSKDALLSILLNAMGTINTNVVRCVCRV